MSPFTRNIAVTAAATLLPALIGLVIAPERTRALPDRISHRVRGLFDDDDTVEASLRRITARLEDLSHQIDARGASATHRMRETSTTSRLMAGIVALLVIPAALTAIFAPGRLRVSRGWDGDGAHREEDDDVNRWGDDVGHLEEALERQREDAVSAVSQAARRGE